jgi:uncharacterized radical SAM superfamily protein
MFVFQIKMASYCAEDIWNLPDIKFLELINSQKLCLKTQKVQFYAPSFAPYRSRTYSNIDSVDFFTISITGNSCALNCKHCQGKVLQTMHSATTPEEVYRLCVQLKGKGGRGCLISGGCLPDGSVPIERFIPIIAKVKRELGLIVLVHTGIMRLETAKQLKVAEVDAALIDIIGSEETIQAVYNLKAKVSDYENSLRVLQYAGLNFVPHIIVGLHDGKLKGEFDALKLIARYNPSAVVIIALTPIHGTNMAKTAPPQPIDIARIIAIAHILMPKTPIALGCMRPKGKHRQETDKLALKAGVNAIAYPTEEAIEYANCNGYKTSFTSLCCAQVYKKSQ